MSHDPYAWWRSALAGKPGELTVGKPEPGFYRHEGRNGHVPVAIWPDTFTGTIYARVGTAPDKIADDDFAHNVFSWCCKHPITEETYWQVMDGGDWPDAPPPRNHNLPADPDEAIKVEIASEAEEIERWLKSVGEITRKEDADRAGNWADRVAELEKRAEATRKRQKQPFLDEAKAVDEDWRPHVERATSLKKRLKDACRGFLLSEQRRLAEERAALLAKGEAPPPATGRSTTKAGSTGRGASLRTVKEAEIVDPLALAAFLIEAKNADLFECLQTIANRIVRAGAEAPGCKLQIRQVAA